MGVNNAGRARRGRGRGPPARILEAHMLAGVTVVDPGSTWIDAGVEIAADARIEPGTQPARRDRGRRRLRGRAADDADRHPPRRERRRAALLPGRVRGPRRLPRRPLRLPAARGPARGRAPRPAPSSRSRTRASAAAPRSPTSPTSATPRSAPAPTSAPARSPPTTTDSASTGRLSAPTHVSALTRCCRTGRSRGLRLHWRWRGDQEDVPDGALAVSENDQRNIEGYAERKAAEAKEEDNS